MLIDLHQDIVMTHPTRASWIADAETGQYGYDAGHQADYTDIDFVMGAIWAYRFEGDPLDLQGRRIVPEMDRVDDYIQAYHAIFGDAIVLSASDVDSPRGDDPHVIIHIEWYEGMETTDMIRDRYEKGVRSFGFSWNFDNTLAWSAATDGLWLTPLGREAVEFMNELGMIIDVAHTSHQGVMNVIQQSRVPIINSHSNVSAIRLHVRNARDVFLQALPQNGGVIGLSAYNGFVWNDLDHATREQFFAHVDYFINLIGSEHIAIGTDFHGISCSRAVDGYQSVALLTRLANDLTDRYGAGVAERICYQNAKRVIQTVLL